MSTTTVGVKLDPSTRERLKKLGERCDRTPHWLIKAAVEEYLAREEAAAAERDEDLARWQRYEESGQFVANEAAMAWLDALARGETPPAPR